MSDLEQDPFSDLPSEPKPSRRSPLLGPWQARKASRAMWSLRSALAKASKRGHYYSSALLVDQLNRVSDFLYNMAMGLKQTAAKRKEARAKGK